jgi:hypothetical protein
MNGHRVLAVSGIQSRMRGERPVKKQRHALNVARAVRVLRDEGASGCT